MKIIFNSDKLMCIDGVNNTMMLKGKEYDVPDNMGTCILTGLFGENLGYEPKKTIKKEEKMVEAVCENKMIKESLNNKILDRFKNKSKKKNKKV